MFDKIRGFFMNVLHLFHSTTIKDVTGIETNITAEMYSAIELWSAMMGGNAPWNDKAPSCGILEQIAGELHVMVSREIGLEVENEAIRPAMEHINKNVDKIVDYITLVGGCVLRPIFANGKLQYEMLPLGHYLPITYDFDGTLTDVLLLKQISIGARHCARHWLLTERHTYTGSEHTVKCVLYKNEGGALHKVDFSDCPQTAEITPEYQWQNIRQPMIVEFRNHAINKIDGSNVPVAIIAGTEGMIRDADEQYERMNWEQEAGEKKIFADRDLFQKRQKRDGTETGVKFVPKLNRLMVQVEGDGFADGKKITEYSPALRTEQQNAMLQQIFRRIELTCNLGKGTISDMENVQQTAEQYNGGRKKLYALVDQIEDEIESKYQQCANIFAHMAAAYGMGSNNSKITVTWNDDQTRKDIQAAKQTALQEITAGVKNEWEYRRDFYGEDETTAKENTPEKPMMTDPFSFGA